MGIDLDRSSDGRAESKFEIFNFKIGSKESDRSLVPGGAESDGRKQV
jgi:hypothetical protein